MATSNNAIEPLDISDIYTIEDWHIRFSQYVLTNSSVTTTNETAFYLTFIGKKAFTLLRELAYPKDVTTMSVKDLQGLLQRHLTPPNLEMAERERFHNLAKKTEEDYKTYILRVQRQAAKCGFKTDLEQQMRDRLVAGIKDPDLKRKLLKETKLDFQGAKQILEDWDAINQAVTHPTEVLMTNRPRQNSNFRRSTKSQANLQHSRANSRNSQPQRNQPNYETNKSSPHQSNRRPGRFQGSCDSCGGNHLRATCRFKQAECRSCHRIGHIASVCRSKPSGYHKANVKAVEFNEHDETPDTEEESICAFKVQSKSESHLYHTVTFNNGSTASFIIDTGSPVTFMPRSVFQTLQLNCPLTPASSSITGITGHSLHIVGQILASVHADGSMNNQVNLPIIITDTGPTILGLDGLRLLNINIVLNSDFSTTLPQAIKDLICACSNCSDGINIEPINLECSGDPKFMKARPIPYGLREPVKKSLDDLVAQGILKAVTSSTWATPIVTPVKPNGQVRICGDYRITVNKQLRQTSCTTPPVDDMFKGLRGSIFSKIDLANAFHQIPLSNEAKELTTINTPYGLYQYQRLPFGIHASPAIFQSVINQILGNLPGVKAYQDDIIVYAHSQYEHNQRLLRLLQVLQKYNVRINAQKSEFSVSSLKYLGYILDSKGISADQERIKAFAQAPRPETPKELQSLLGFAQFYSRFVPNFADIVRPLYVLLQESKSTKQLHWSDSALQAYQTLVQDLMHGRVLKTFQLGLQSELIVDASEYAIGAILQQEGHPIVCISRKLSTSEQSYSQTMKEALAIHWSILRLHKYLFGQPFQLITDHQALTYIFGKEKSVSKSTSRMLQRWALDLSGYQYKIIHKPGSQILHADYMSRYSDFDAPEVCNAFTQILPGSRNELINETRLFYGPVIAGLRNGWSASAKRRFPIMHANRENLFVSADGVIFFQERPVIPPTLRNSFLQFLHAAHLGRDKTLSLSRYTCWWPRIADDINAFIRSCQACKKKAPNRNHCIPWPAPFRTLQRIHADYCGPFLDNNYALIIEDSYSKWPEVFITKHATAEFTKNALQKYFAREGIAQIMITDNGTHFTAQHLETWLKDIGCKHITTAPRHPQSNGIAENFVRTLKTAVKTSNPATIQELHKCIDTFLLHYRNCRHATTGQAPAVLFKGRTLRMSSLDSADIQFYRGNNNRVSDGMIISKHGNRMFSVLDLNDGSVHRRHRDQITVNTPSSTLHQNNSPIPFLEPAISSHDTIIPEHIPPHEPLRSDPVEEADPEGASPTKSASPSSAPAPVVVPNPSPTVPRSPAVPSVSPTAPLRRSTRIRKRPDRYGTRISSKWEEDVTARPT